MSTGRRDPHVFRETLIEVDPPAHMLDGTVRPSRCHSLQRAAPSAPGFERRSDRERSEEGVPTSTHGGIARSRRMVALGIVLGLGALAPRGGAVDGVVEINQDSALAGGVTPGDSPGFPITLSQAGSYVLTSNLVLNSGGVHGIELTASHVTLDLNGSCAVARAAWWVRETGSTGGERTTSRCATAWSAR